MRKEISNEQYCWNRFIKRREEFIAGHTFKTAGELHYSAEQLTGMAERIISVEIDGQARYPTFQFDSTGRVYEILQAHLPRLLGSGRSGWDVCFWLFAEFTVVMKTVRPDAKLLRGISLDEALRIGAIASKLEGVRSEMPIDLVTTNDKETFAVFIEALLNPDYRKIPEITVDWNTYFDVPRG